MYESIKILLERIKADIIRQYHQKGLRASGSFERNMSIQRNGRYKTVLKIPFYSQYIMAFKSNKGGRRPTGPEGTPPSSVIEKWIRDKRLSLRDYLTGQYMSKTDSNVKKVAFLIKRKIQKQGTDIHLGKRQPIDLDQIINDQLDYAGNEMADRILQEIKI